MYFLLFLERERPNREREPKLLQVEYVIRNVQAFFKYLQKSWYETIDYPPILPRSVLADMKIVVWSSLGVCLYHNLRFRLYPGPCRMTELWLYWRQVGSVDCLLFVIYLLFIYLLCGIGNFRGLCGLCLFPRPVGAEWLNCESIDGILVRSIVPCLLWWLN